MKLLLHVCCGPCSLEPYRILKDEGFDITLYYSNDNIYPEEEFYKRKETLNKWAKDNNISVIYDTYDHKYWKGQVKNRCEDCYRQRLEKAAQYALNNNYEYLTTSLSVSPYQFTQQIKNILEDTCTKYKLKSKFVDFRPYYKNATKKSLELGMYRQKYCGCEYSLKERNEQVKQKKLNIENQLKLQEESKKRKANIKAKQDRKRELLQQYKNQSDNASN